MHVGEPVGVLLLVGETSSTSRRSFFTCCSDDFCDQRKNSIHNEENDTAMYRNAEGTCWEEHLLIRNRTQVFGTAPK